MSIINLLFKKAELVLPVLTHLDGFSFGKPVHDPLYELVDDDGVAFVIVEGFKVVADAGIVVFRAGYGVEVSLDHVHPAFLIHRTHLVMDRDPAKERRVEDVEPVGGEEQDGFALEGVEDLHQADDDAVHLAVYAAAAMPESADGVNLVYHEDAGPTFDVVEDAADIFCGFAEVARDGS